MASRILKELRTPALAAALVVGCLTAACGGGSSLPDGLYAKVFTTKGLIVGRLEPDLTPLAVANFVGLAEGTIENAAFDLGRPFFDGTSFPRVAPGHVIQGGSPASDRADGPGYTFPNEISAALSHDHAGAMNFANGGPHTNAAQWCIMLGDRSYLDGDYIVFGNVIEGLDVVFTITPEDVVDSVRIVRVGNEAERFHPTTESFRDMVQAAEARAAEQEVLKARTEAEWIRQNHPGLEGPDGGVRFAVLSSGTGVRPADGVFQVSYRGTRVRYMGHLLGYEGPPLETTAFGSREDGVPGFVDPPLPFPYQPGVTSINPGLDGVLAEMTPGERRVVLVPSDLGYGRNGTYPPETPGEPRFIIGPNTLLVYEVEVLPAG